MSNDKYEATFSGGTGEDALVEKVALAIRWGQENDTRPEENPLYRCARHAVAEMLQHLGEVQRAAKVQVLRDVAEAHRENRKSSQHPIWPSELDLIADGIEAVS